MAIDLITFDLDDTLWPCMPVIRAAEHSLYDWLGRHAPGIVAQHDIDSLRSHRLDLARRRPALAHDVTALRQVQLQLLMDEHGHAPELAVRAAAHFRAERNRVEPYPDVPDALTRLGRRYRLVSLTNGNAQLEHTPLAGCFDHSLDAGQVGAAKPDPTMFIAACDWAGVSPQRSLHVGDDPLRDIAAARALGMQTAWINRDGADWPVDQPPADLTFDSLVGLADHLLDMHEDHTS